MGALCLNLVFAIVVFMVGTLAADGYTIDPCS